MQSKSRPLLTRAAQIWRPATCQFIEGEASADDACKCGRPVEAVGSAYCAEHARRCRLGVRKQADDSSGDERDDRARSRAWSVPY